MADGAVSKNAEEGQTTKPSEDDESELDIEEMMKDLDQPVNLKSN